VYISDDTFANMIALALVFGTTALAFDHQDCSQKHSAEHTVCKYMRKYERVYTPEEFNERFNNVMARSEHASHSDEGVQYGLNSISDRPFVKNNRLNSEKPYTGIQHHQKLLQAYKLPKSLDLRDKMQPVKDQGACGGCFAFASAAVLEYWEGNHPKSLSAQSIIDCTSGKQRPNVGCDGGLMEYVFEYAKQHPVPLANDFPFEGHQNECPRHSLQSNVLVKDYRVLMIEDNPKAEQQIEHILHNYGPVAVGVDSANMYHYTGGLFKASMCTTDIDHAVTIVGYTDDAWIIKNSWGPFWGDEGYLYLERGKNACGVAEYIVYIKDAYATHKYVNTLWHMSG